MLKINQIAPLIAIGALAAVAADWPMQDGGPERNGWARSEHILTPATINKLKLLYTYRAQDAGGGLTAPIISGNLITYRGFKEMLIFAAEPNRIFSVDADLNKTIWDTTLSTQSNAPAPANRSDSCGAGSSGPVAMAGSSSATMHFAAAAARTPAPGAPAPPRRSPYFPPLWQSIYPMSPETLTRLNVIYTISSDGYLHVVNSSTGADLISPVQFVPAHAKVTGINLWDNWVYATTADNCDGFRNALYAINLLPNEKQVLVYSPEVGGFAGTAGTAIGRDGTLYVQVMQPAEKTGEYRDTVLALDPRTLAVRASFSPAREKLSAADLKAPGITPMVFSWRGKPVVAAGMHDGHVYLLDAQNLGGADHHTPIYSSPEIAANGRKHEGAGFYGTFSTWQNVDTEERWIYAPLNGPPAKAAHYSASPTSSLIALKLGVTNNETTFAPLWISGELTDPTPGVIANGMVFTLARGTQAALHVLDALTGKELHSSGNSIKGKIDGSGLALANGRIYFSTNENSVYCLGLANANLQLTEDDDDD